MNIISDFPVASRVKVYLMKKVFYEGIVVFHFDSEPHGSNKIIIEDGNKEQHTFVFFTKLNGKEGWALIPNTLPSGFALGQEDTIYLIKRVEIPKGTKRFSFIECTCPELSKGKHGHIFDVVEGENSQHIYSIEDAETYFSFIKKSNRIIGNDSVVVDGVMEEIKKYFN